MADRNNLVLTVVIVAAALLFFNGGLTGNAVSSYYQRSAAMPGDYCVYDAVIRQNPDGTQDLFDVCTKTERCKSNKDTRTASCESTIMQGTRSYS